MPPKRASRATAAAAKSETTSESASQDASQDNAAKLFQGIQAKLERETIDASLALRQRRSKREAAILDSHTARVEKLHADVQKVFDSHDDKLRAIRRPKVEQLVSLVNKKAELESRIDKCQAELAKAYEEAAQQLQASVDGRVEDLAM